MHSYKKNHSIYGVQYNLRCQASTEGHGTCSLWIRRDYCTFINQIYMCVIYGAGVMECIFPLQPLDLSNIP